ncbi:hypothetical protein FQN60_005073, partial [Etheostoma spectabile]
MCTHLQSKVLYSTNECNHMQHIVTSQLISLSCLFSIAMATKENMTSQRGFLKSIQSRVNTLANRFPTINNLIQRINLRKRRDSLILGTETELSDRRTLEAPEQKDI